MTPKKLTAAQLRRIEKAVDSVPFARLLGIEVETVEPGAATLALAIRPELKQNHGVVHGGAVASLIDTATAFAILSLLARGEKITTVDLTISYLRPLTAGRATAKARVVRAGRRLFVVSAEVFDGEGKLAATALSTYIKV
ncbi:MAG TPA: PaaI family thioesterase [Pyrinomonadaceae bacterium]|jgi:acyl-CoA thioesterase|nr:PaaI family thioesterase [Pyrinomonadaceae bacterium]